MKTYQDIIKTPSGFSPELEERIIACLYRRRIVPHRFDVIDIEQNEEGKIIVKAYFKSKPNIPITYHWQLTDLEVVPYNYHPQTSVVYPFTGESIEVDEGLVSLLKLIWSCGWETLFSCQGEVEEMPAYIIFKHIPDAEAFCQTLNLPPDRLQIEGAYIHGKIQLTIYFATKDMGKIIKRLKQNTSVERMPILT